MNKIDHIDLYKKYIQDIYRSLERSGKDGLTNNDLCKLFEYYSCVKLQEQYNKPFHLYEDIDPDFKESNKMSYSDTGIDACDLDSTIVQCKLRQNMLGWSECSTFFGSNIIKSDNELQIKWKNMVITRNACSKLSKNLFDKSDLFDDVTYDKKEMLAYCDNLLQNPIVLQDEIEPKLVLRDYQKECIKLIKDSGNCIINIPTGTGKNVIIINSLLKGKSYLILVPKITLMDQLYDEILKQKPSLKNQIQLIGDGKSKYDAGKLITICVYNSIGIVADFSNFEKIFVDEAHHIAIPEIYSSELVVNNDVKETYIDKIVELRKLNNNVYLSATIDKIDGFEYYSKDIRVMIEQGYLCDYTLNVPVFNNDPTDQNICEYLIAKYRNVIIYCDTQEHGTRINKIMNELLNDCSEYIDCKTSKTKRVKTITKYKSSEIPFLVNVRVLTEGFDAPITKGVCFMHLPKSGTTIIQIIGRALRLHKEKKLAHVILPYSCDDDLSSIKSFLRVVAKNDSRIKKSYESKTLGGYINIVNTVSNCNADKVNDIELRYEMIFNSLGELENDVEIWLAKLQLVIDYIEKYGKRPSGNKKSNSTTEEQTYGKWLSHQITNFNNHDKYTKQPTIHKVWNAFLEKYKTYFLTNTEKWFINFDKIQDYVNKNNKFPSELSTNINIKKLAIWVRAQKECYSNNNRIFSTPQIFDEWKKFMEKNTKYFLSTNEKWFLELEASDNYIEKYNKIPVFSDNNIICLNNVTFTSGALGKWISNQKQAYQLNIDIMKDQNIYDKWTQFLEKHSDFLMSYVEKWENNLSKLTKYIDENNSLPSEKSDNINIKNLAVWLRAQKCNYRTRNKIMKNNNDVVIKWEQFIDQYKSYFSSVVDIWYEHFENLQKYIKTNKKLPTRTSENCSLAKWISHQRENYKNKKKSMNNAELYEIWSNFIKEYAEYFA